MHKQVQIQSYLDAFARLVVRLRNQGPATGDVCLFCATFSANAETFVVDGCDGIGPMRGRRNRIFRKVANVCLRKELTVMCRLGILEERMRKYIIEEEKPQE